MLWDREPHEIRQAFPLKSGGQVIFERQPPHGHWTARMSSGKHPEALRGSYLTLSSALRAVKKYLQSKSRPTEIIDEVLDG